MPIPKPHYNESQKDYIGRCARQLAKVDAKTPQKQRLAICYSTWRETKKKK